MPSKRRPVDAAILGWPMKVLFSLACAAAIAAAPASAADLLGTAPPLPMPASQAPMFEVGTNWYVRGNLGVSFDRAPSVSFSTIALPPLSAVGAPFTIGNGANWSTTNFTGGAGFGYRWNDWLRFDATWDYRTGPGGSRQATVVCPYGLTGVSSPGGVPLRLSLRHDQHLQRVGEPAAVRQHFPRQRLCRSWNLLRLHPLHRRRRRAQHEHANRKRELQRDRQRPALCR